MVAARKLVREQKWPEAESAFLKIVRANPKMPVPGSCLDSPRHSQAKYSEALAAFEENYKLSQSPLGMYNMAAAHSRLKNTEKAYEWLEKALNGGAAFSVNIDTDKDLDFIRNDARFAKMQDIVKRRRNPCLYNPKNREFDFWDR